MGISELLRGQLRQAHGFLDHALSDVSDDQAHWQPLGVANPLGATCAHLLIGEDTFIAGLSGSAALCTGAWADGVGVSELPPMSEPGSALPLKQDWGQWGRRVRIDLPTLRDYGAAVQAAGDTFLASLTDDDLDRVFDLSDAGFGEQPLSWVVSAGVIGHVLAHWGEIVCLKGLQGSRGFPV